MVTIASLLVSTWAEGRIELFYCTFVILLHLQVFDDQGKDVTPRPLYRPELNVAHRQSKILSVHDFAGVTQPDFLSSLSMQQTSVASISLAGPFSRYDMTTHKITFGKTHTDFL